MEETEKTSTGKCILSGDLGPLGYLDMVSPRDVAYLELVLKGQFS